MHVEKSNVLDAFGKAPSRGRAPKIKMDGTSPSGPTESLIALTAISKASLSSIPGASLQMILNACRIGEWWRSTVALHYIHTVSRLDHDRFCLDMQHIGSCLKSSC